MNDQQRRNACDTFIHGNVKQSPAAHFADMAAWCEAHDIEHDNYGEGDLIQGFERKIASLLGFEAGLFCVTGTMTQMVALRLACQARGSNLVGLHRSAHILVHENSNVQVLDMFKTLTLGEPYLPWLAEHLSAIPDHLGAVLYELPMREIGGQLPAWEQLDAIKVLAASRGTHLHMDGARLWEAATGYGRPLAEVCAGFDSVYVSFYKGIGGLGGAMLLGTADFLAKARVWIKRMGGNLVQRSPYVVSAAMQFDARLAAMPRWLAATRDLAALLAEFPNLQRNPATPQVNMLHLYMPVSTKRAKAIRDQIADEERAWLFGHVADTALPDQCMTEWYLADNLCQIAPARLRHLLARLSFLLEQPA